MRTTAASPPAGSPENERWRRRVRRPTSAGWGRAAGWRAEPPAGKKERDLAVGERQRPGHLRGDVIADGARQDEAHRAERCPGGASLWSGAYPSREFAIQQLFTRSIDQCRSVLLSCRNHNVRPALRHSDACRTACRFGGKLITSTWGSSESSFDAEAACWWSPRKSAGCISRLMASTRSSIPFSLS